MVYSEIQIEEINDKYQEVNRTDDKLLLRFMTFQQKLKNEKAREYLIQGVGRRVKTLTRCINNIFTIFPVERSEHLSKEELIDLNINLHAFFINIAGIFDNLGWVFVYENDLFGKAKEGKIDRNGVGLFIKKTQENLNPELRGYLDSNPIKSWHEDYSKNYRDSLAHRIPLYVPPSLLDKAGEKEFQEIEEQLQALDFSKALDRDKYDELRDKQRNLGNVSHIFAHSINEGSRPVFFHAQILADYLTVEEVIETFCEKF